MRFIASNAIIFLFFCNFDIFLKNILPTLLKVQPGVHLVEPLFVDLSDCLELYFVLHFCNGTACKIPFCNLLAMQHRVEV